MLFDNFVVFCLFGDENVTILVKVSFFDFCVFFVKSCIVRFKVIIAGYSCSGMSIATK